MQHRKAKPVKTPQGHSIPSMIQLPGGVRLSGVAFAVRAVDAAGRPTLFEIMPVDHPHAGPSLYTLFVDEAQLRAPGQKITPRSE